MTQHMVRFLLMTGISVVSLTAVGCGDGGPLGWRFDVADDVGPAARREARIRQGGCEGQLIYAASEGQSTAPDLDDGTYGFEGIVIDEGCGIIGQGCVEVTLPSEGDIVVPITALEGDGLCDSDQCVMGVCRNVPTTDAGPGDADAMVDADTGMDATPDTMPDTQPPPVICQNDAECDDSVFCNGVERCAPEDPGASPEGCAAAAAPACPPAEICDEFGRACTAECPDADGDGFTAASCGGQDCDDGDMNRNPDRVEICDGIDQNCDNRIDEGFTVGSSCLSEGACGRGVLGCDATTGETLCSTAPGGSADASTAEICDGADNDCDGTVDEGLGLGDSCMGAGGCGAGVLECDGASGIRCSTDPGGSSDGSGTESCDGMDNDCDGMVDEGLGVGDACMGEGACGAGVLECDGSGGTRCSTNPGSSNDASGAETCDGTDQDCDGSTDEDFNVGMACMGTGTCGAGVIECQAAGAGCSTDVGGSASASTPESCNGGDDDCDGNIDEGLMVGSPCTGMGECGDGTLECDGSGGTQCDTAPGGSDDESVAETCDGLDNDCDGTSDEDLGLGAACMVVGACGAGTVECLSTGMPGCSSGPGGSMNMATAETCDSVDNDCDGDTDEDFMIGTACNGEGACGAGVFECGGTGNQCSTDVGASNDASMAETCDGVDNDCDGSIDEDFNVGSACSGVGQCGAGMVECLGDGSAACSTDPGGSADASGMEMCGGGDEDCDGMVDEFLSCPPIINEVYYDEPGTDGPNIFTELWGTPGADLNGFTLEGINGSNGSVYESVDLTGAIIPADGLLVIAEAGATGPTLAARDFAGDVDWQNGPDSVLLKDPGGVVIDALAYGSSGILMGEGTPAPDVSSGRSLSRGVGHVDTNDNVTDFVSNSTPTPGAP